MWPALAPAARRLSRSVDRAAPTADWRRVAPQEHFSPSPSSEAPCRRRWVPASHWRASRWRRGLAEARAAGRGPPWRRQCVLPCRRRRAATSGRTPTTGVRPGWTQGRGGRAAGAPAAAPAAAVCRAAAAAAARRARPLAPPPAAPAAAELPGSEALNAKYVPFQDVASGASSGEVYSLDEVLYRARDGGLLDVQVGRGAAELLPAGLCWKAAGAWMQPQQRTGKPAGKPRALQAR